MKKFKTISILGGGVLLTSLALAPAHASGDDGLLHRTTRQVKTTHAPVPAPPPSTMPEGDLPGWHQVYAEDFNKATRAGAFRSTYPQIVDYGDGTRDTSKNGVYDNGRNLTAQGGLADIHYQTRSGIPSTAVMVPGGWVGQTYGRYSIRYRADSAAGYKAALMLWPSSDKWSEGEVDYPEGDFDGGQMGFAHEVGPNPSRNVYAFQAASSWTAWHTATIDWSPGLLVFSMDGKEVGRTTAKDAVPTTPHRWVIQVETSLDGTKPAPSTQGHFQVDWMTFYERRV